MMRPQDVKHIVVHTSDSKWGMVSDINQWHKARKFDMIGYQFVITNAFPSYNALKNNSPDHTYDGVVWRGRPELSVGAHCIGLNQSSLGVCLIGSDGVYTPKQISNAVAFVAQLCKKYNIPYSEVVGHGETKSGKAEGKTCPVYDMNLFRNQLMGTDVSCMIEITPKSSGL